MAVERFSPDVIADMKETIKKTMMEILPDVVEQMNSVIPEMVREMTPMILKQTTEANTLTDLVLEALSEMILEDRVLEYNPEFWFTKFRLENQEYLDNQLDEREEKYYQFKRCDTYVQFVYEECLSSEPVYIRKCYRFRFLNEIEGEAENVKKLQSEFETLRDQRTKLLNDIAVVDAETKEFIERNLKNEVKELALERWKECVREDVVRIDKKWQQKMETIRKAFEEDKKLLELDKNPVVDNDDTSPPKNSNELQEKNCQTYILLPQCYMIAIFAIMSIFLVKSVFFQ